VRPRLLERGSALTLVSNWAPRYLRHWQGIPADFIVDRSLTYG
jgi:hypothetical protein